MEEINDFMMMLPTLGSRFAYPWDGWIDWRAPADVVPVPVPGLVPVPEPSFSSVPDLYRVGGDNPDPFALCSSSVICNLLVFRPASYLPGNGKSAVRPTTN